MWSEGEVVVRREVLLGRAWAEVPVIVVRDDQDLLVTYLPPGASFSFPEHAVPHPWQPREAWSGHGMLSLQRPGDAYAVFVFWHGAEREFRSWYLNLQDPFRRRLDAFETADHELDLILHTDGRVEWKDHQLLDVRVTEGRFTQDQADGIRAEARRLEAELAARGHWWHSSWALWEPHPAWDAATT
jgi:hypothetical protein